MEGLVIALPKARDPSAGKAASELDCSTHVPFLPQNKSDHC